MKLWVCSLVFVAVACLTVSCQTCPADYFKASFLATLELYLEEGVTPYIPDPELKFFKDVLKFRDSEIQHITYDAIKFFNESFGLDFSNSIPNDQNEYFIENAKMSPFAVKPETPQLITINSWIRTGSTRSNCYKLRNGVFTVSFSDNVTLHGSYGGPAGKPAGSTYLVYGFYHIDVCHQSPVIIQFQTATPFRSEPIDGIKVFNYDLYNRVLGRGQAQGTIIRKPDPSNPGYDFVSIRNAFTFPA